MTPTLILASRYVVRRKMRAGLTTMAIACGVALLMAVQTLLPSLQQSLEDSLRATMGQVDFSLSTKSQSPFDATVVEKVRALRSVKRASVRLQSRVFLAPESGLTLDGKPIRSIAMIGVEVGENSPALPLSILEGEALSKSPSNGVLVSAKLFEQNNMTLGSKFLVPAVSGALEALVVGTVRTPVGTQQDTIFTSLTFAQEVFALPGKARELHVIFDQDIDAQAAQAAQASILDALGPRFQGEVNSANQQLIEMLQQFSAPMTAFSALALLMAGFIIFITFRTVVVERRQDLGLLRALGATRRRLLIMVTLEGALQGVAGTVLGLAFGLLLSRFFVAGMSPIWESQMGLTLEPAPVSFGALLLAATLGIGASVISAVIPARDASRVSPVQGMRNSVAPGDDEESKRRLLGGAVSLTVSLLCLLSGTLPLQAIGASFFIAALFLLGPGVIGPITRWFSITLLRFHPTIGRIASGNIARQRRRSAITAAVMTMALASIVTLFAAADSAVAGLLASIDRNLGADYLLMPAGAALGSAASAGTDPALADQLRALAGVEEATSLRVWATKANERHVLLVGVDPDRYPSVGAFTLRSQTSDEALLKLQAARTTIAGSQWALQTQSSVGDIVSIETLIGAVDYTVIGIGDETLQNRVPALYVSQADLERDFAHTKDAIVLLALKSRPASTATATAIDSAAAHYPALEVLSVGKWKADLMGDVEKKMSALYFLLFVFIIPALLGLANTLGINVLERTREIGLMRAVGSTRRQIRRIVLAEALLLSIVGAASGIALGLWIGLLYAGMLVNFGFPSGFVFPSGGVAGALFIGLTFGALAAVFPARHAAALQIVNALRHR